MKLLVDMNLSPRWCEKLARAKIDAVHWSSIGPASAPDTEIMAFAAENDMVVLTHDLDFGTLLSASRGLKPSVIQLRADNPSPESAGPHVVRVVHMLAAEIKQGVLLTVDTTRVRVTMLPLRDDRSDSK